MLGYIVYKDTLLDLSIHFLKREIPLYARKIHIITDIHINNSKIPLHRIYTQNIYTEYIHESMVQIFSL